MPKMKTRRSAAKRFSLTAKGKIKFKRRNMRHILSKMSSKSKRHLKKGGILCDNEYKKIKRCLPYGA